MSVRMTQVKSNPVPVVAGQPISTKIMTVWRIVTTTVPIPLIRDKKIPMVTVSEMPVRGMVMAMGS
jgi:hypothetical protein